MDERFVELRKLGELFPDEKRHPTIAESRDWEEHIVPVIVEWCKALQQIVEGAKPDTAYTLAPMLRVLAEIIYMLGYERGKREQQNTGDDLSAFEF